ncbi:MAG: calcium-binding protein [Pseudomonadota bacterium]
MSNGTSGDDILTGDSGDNTLNGFAGNDTLDGLEGNDFLNGGSGADTMSGGLGDDRYSVDDVLDIVMEAMGEGLDRVDSFISYRLGANVEQLVLKGSDDLDGFGNELDNKISGNSGDNVLYGYDGDDVLNGFNGNDILNGGAGRDFLVGGNGDDTYIVDDTLDRVRQEKATAAGGDDKVIASVDFTLPANVETLQLSGSADINGTGSNDDNSIVGNSGNNVLSGRDGDDTLNGNGGDDTLYGGDGEDNLIGGGGADMLVGGDDGDRYTIRDALDTVVEEAGDSGIDTMRSTVDITIADNVERLVLIGSATEATGNDDAQTIIGNGSANVISGLGGDDTLEGRGGDDTFVFEGADYGANTIADFAGAGAAGGDTIDVSDFGFTSIADMMGQGVTFVGSVIDFSGVAGLDGSIDMTGVDVTTLVDGDFDFI